MVEGSDQRISNRLQPIGFAPSTHVSPQIQVGPFLFMGAMMIVGMLGVVSVVSPHEQHVLPNPVTAILIGTTRAIGILTAILPKLRWSNSRPDRDGNPPYLAWLGWAVAAAIISLVIERSAYAIALRSLTAGLDFSANPVTPMAPMAFSTSLVISILCDIDLRLGHGWARRVSEGLLSAVAAVMSIYICTQLLLIAASTARFAAWMPYVGARIWGRLFRSLPVPARARRGARRDGRRGGQGGGVSRLSSEPAGRNEGAARRPALPRLAGEVEQILDPISGR
jgi:hypothetical protein